jgi:hypothetical protein
MDNRPALGWAQCVMNLELPRVNRECRLTGERAGGGEGKGNEAHVVRQRARPNQLSTTRLDAYVSCSRWRW